MGGPSGAATHTPINLDNHSNVEHIIIVDNLLCVESGNNDDRMLRG